MIFFKSIIHVGLILLIVTSQSAPTDPQPDKEEIGFIITESYHGQSVTKDLYCGNTSAHGTHPHPREACDDILGILNGTHTDPPPETCICTDQYDPVDVTLSIVLPNEPNHPYQTSVQFGNACMFHCKTQPVPHFVDIGVVPPSSVPDANGGT